MSPSISDLDDDLLRRARRLPTAIAPPRDLWPDVQRQLGQRRSPGPARFAIAAVLLMTLSSAVTLLVSESLRDPEPAPGTAALTAAVPQAAFGPRHVLSDEFLNSRAELRRSVEEALSELAPQARWEVAENLSQIEHARARINEALQSHPDSELLQHLLLSGYLNEMALLRELHDFTRTLAVRREVAQTRRIET